MCLYISNMKKVRGTRLIIWRRGLRAEGEEEWGGRGRGRLLREWEVEASVRGEVCGGARECEGMRGNARECERMRGVGGSEGSGRAGGSKGAGAMWAVRKIRLANTFFLVKRSWLKFGINADYASIPVLSLLSDTAVM